MSIEERFVRIEKGNLFWKRLALSLLAAIWAVVLMGQANEEKAQDLVLRSMSLVDDEGATGCELRVVHGQPHLIFYDAEYRPRLVLGVGSDGSPFEFMLDEAGTNRVALVADRRGPARIDFRDAAGTTRTSLGVERGTGGRARFQKGTLMMFDANFNVTWQAPPQ